MIQGQAVQDNRGACVSLDYLNCGPAIDRNAAWACTRATEDRTIDAQEAGAGGNFQRLID